MFEEGTIEESISIKYKTKKLLFIGCDLIDKNEIIFVSEILKHCLILYYYPPKETKICFEYNIYYKNKLIKKFDKFDFYEYERYFERLK